MAVLGVITVEDIIQTIMETSIQFWAYLEVPLHHGEVARISFTERN